MHIYYAYLCISEFMKYVEIFLGIFINTNVSESHSNTTVHQFEAMNLFSWYLAIFLPKYHGMVFTNTAHP